MHPYRSPTVFPDVSNVVDLRRYRDARRLRSSSNLARLRAGEKPPGDLWLHDDYRERMKVNVVVFAFLLFLITSGVWLPDGLTASFGPEHLLHHHTQNRDAGPGRIVSLPGGVGDIL
ncbi:MAG: hypothetical protein WBY84_16005 [Pseudolabrys sp.]